MSPPKYQLIGENQVNDKTEKKEEGRYGRGEEDSGGAINGLWNYSRVLRHSLTKWENHSSVITFIYDYETLKKATSSHAPANKTHLKRKGAKTLK